MFLNVWCYLLLILGQQIILYTMTDASGVQICLAQVSQVKDLGVWFTNSLTPTLQCQEATNKAMQVIEDSLSTSLKNLINSTTP